MDRPGRLAALAAVVVVSACTQVGVRRAPPSTPSPTTAAGTETRTDPVRRGNPDRGGPELPPETPPWPDVAAIEPGSEEEAGFDPLDIPDARPRADEPPSRYGNAREYEVFGRTYRVLETSEGYDEEGQASWYGEQFHGRPTSSQEPFDMYSMTAAHKSLPIPSYVQVENMDNGRLAVVRVNDRGPFHEGRIIDLSYAAALKLGVVGPGTARVRVRAIGPVQTRR